MSNINNNELISICIATYNGGEYIEKTLTSITKQNLKNIEVIISDDLSTDNTLEICNRFKNKLNLHIFKNEKRLGLVGNWNKAVSLSSGKYIKLMGQDDILLDNCIKEQVNVIKKHNAVAAFSKCAVINKYNKILLVRSLGTKEKCFEGTKLAKKALLYRNIFFEPVNLTYTRKAYENAGGYDKDLIYTPDWEYGIRLSLIGKVCYIPKVLTAFRTSPSSETGRLYKSKMKAVNEDSFLLFDKYKDKLDFSLLRRIFFRTSIRIMTLLRLYFMRFNRE